MACDKVMARNEQAQNGNVEKFSVESQAKIIFFQILSSFRRNISADICLLMKGLDKQGFSLIDYKCISLFFNSILGDFFP